VVTLALPARRRSPILTLAVAAVAGWLVIPLACGGWRTIVRDA
jgi:hypothetical protein